MSETSAFYRARAKLDHVIRGHGPSLAVRVIRGSGWTIAGNFGGQALRFVSNIWLTHLLYPAAFGLMAIAQAIIIGVHMLSDVGLQQSIIRSERGHEPEFLNTIWTLQVLKGLGMFLVMIVIAHAVADAYHQPLLAWIMPSLGLAALVGSFASTKIVVLNRNIEIGKIVSLELGTQVVGILVMGLWAWLSPTPWALVAGNLVNALAMTLGTHLLVRGTANRFALHRATVRETWSFGGWVMISSGLTYLAGEGRNLLNGSLVDSKTIGLLVISTTLSMVMWTAIQSVSGRVLFPAYSTVWRERPQDFASVVERSRRIQLLAGCAVAILLAIFGDRVVNLFYDARYREAGAFLQIQAAGSISGFIGASYYGVMWANGRARLNIVVLVTQLVATGALIVIGHAIGGVLGLVVGVSATGLAVYPFNSFIYWRLGLFQPKTDFLPFLISIALAVYVYLFGAWNHMRF
jgi:O-antigen/teichoic acid export membrane protein